MNNILGGGNLKIFRPPPDHSLLKNIIFAVASTVAVLIIRIVFFHDTLGDSHPFSLFLIAIVLSSYYGGFAGGIIALLFSFYWAFLYFIPLSSIPFSPEAMMRMLLFTSTSVIIILLFESMHMAWRRSAALEKKLQEQASVLKEQDQRKDEFIAILAHELRNPLAPISNALQIIAHTDDKKLQQESIDIASNQVLHMVRLLDDLLDVSRIIHGKITLQKKDLDLRDVIRTSVTSVTPIVNERSHQLTYTLPENPVRINGDVTRLVQLFGNLLNNSAKYTPNKGMINLSMQTEGEDVVIRITDNGIGIPHDKLSQVFDMFMQVDSSLERSQGGLGVGLMLVKNIAELHNGSVVVKSEEDKGAEFIVRLPLASRE